MGEAPCSQSTNSALVAGVPSPSVLLRHSRELQGAETPPRAAADWEPQRAAAGKRDAGAPCYAEHGKRAWVNNASSDNRAEEGLRFRLNQKSEPGLVYVKLSSRVSAEHRCRRLRLSQSRGTCTGTSSGKGWPIPGEGEWKTAGSSTCAMLPKLLGVPLSGLPSRQSPTAARRVLFLLLDSGALGCLRGE